MSILPPFEGWDEYQHIAFVEHLIEHGSEPVMGQSIVPRSMHIDLVRYPHPPFGADQVRRLGAVDYAQFWSRDERPTLLLDARDLPLYQAQQPPLYYRLVAPLYGELKAQGGMLVAITGLRLVNVCLCAAAVAVALGSISLLLRRSAHRYLVGMIVATQPLFLLNCARVANDALAVLLGSISVSMLFQLLSRWSWWRAVVAGTALGLAILSKTNLLGLIPFVFAVFLWLAWRRKATWGRAMSGAAITLGVAAAITYPYFRGNFSRHGVVTPLQEAVKNEASGRGVLDLARAAAEIDWRRDFVMRLFRQSLWRGGWSMLGLETPILGVRQPLPTLQGVVVVCAIIAASYAAVRRRLGESVFTGGGETSLAIGSLGAGMTAALAYHAIHSQAAVGNVGTNVWYGAVVFPWLICLVYAGLAKLPWRLMTLAFTIIWLFDQVLAECAGTLSVMIPSYYGERWSEGAKERIDALHPAGWGTAITVPSIVCAGVCFVMALGIAVRSVVDRRERVASG